MCQHEVYRRKSLLAGDHVKHLEARVPGLLGDDDSKAGVLSWFEDLFVDVLLELIPVSRIPNVASLKERNHVSYVTSKDVGEVAIDDLAVAVWHCRPPMMWQHMTDTYTLVERNPYYNWVDTEGQQLPYIDRILSTKATDADAANVMILSGEIDVVLDDFARLPDMPLYLEGAERAGYYVQTSGGFTSPPLLYINHDYDYELWQQMLDYFARNYMMIWSVGSIVQPNIFSNDPKSPRRTMFPIQRRTDG